MRALPTPSMLQAEVRLVTGFGSSDVGFLRQTDNSTLYRLRNGRAGRHYLLKVCNGRRAARLQYDSLVRAYDFLGSARLSVPEPAFLLSELGAYCIEFVDGKSVRQRLEKQVASGTERSELSRRCGEWVASYHRAFHENTGRIDIDNRLESLEEDTVSIRERVPGDKTVERIREWMLERAEDVSRCDVSWGKLHGDCKADNFLVSRDRLLGIDIETRADGVQMMDLVQFVNNVTSLCFVNPSLRIANGRGRLTASFVEGYVTVGDADSLALRWLRMLHLVHMMNSSLTSKGFLSTSRYRYLREHARSLLS